MSSSQPSCSVVPWRLDTLEVVPPAPGMTRSTSASTAWSGPHTPPSDFYDINHGLYDTDSSSGYGHEYNAPSSSYSDFDYSYTHSAPVYKYEVASPTHSDLSQKKEYICLWPGCPQKPFARSADLDRHQKQVHLANNLKEEFKCDYKRCDRSTGAFHRKDHFRDHLREYHCEDLPKRGHKEKMALDPRYVNASWWRCSKCLKRVNVATKGYECPECKLTCERERQNMRAQLRA